MKALRNAPNPILFVPTLVVRTIKELGDDDATHMAAGVAYYALFSLFPLLLGLIAIIGLAADSNTVRSEILEWAAENLPGTGDFISDNVIASAEASGSLGAISIIGLIWSGSAIFGAITKVVNRAWDIQHDRPFIKGKIMQLSMAMSVGILFALALTSASLAQTAERYAHTDMPVLGQADEVSGMLLFRTLSFVFNLAIFLSLYKVLPNTQTHWRYIWPGALVAALLFEGSKFLFVLYLDNFATFNAVYGSIGSVIALLLWAYVSAFILILGAEMSSEFGRMIRGIDRGKPIVKRSGQEPFF